MKPVFAFRALGPGHVATFFEVLAHHYFGHPDVSTSPSIDLAFANASSDTLFRGATGLGRLGSDAAGNVASMAAFVIVFLSAGAEGSRGAKVRPSKSIKSRRHWTRVAIAHIA